MPTRPLVTRYEQDLALFPSAWHRAGVAAAVVFLAIFPLVASAPWLTVANRTLVTVVGAVSLMILSGLTGQLSLGHAAFLAVGAYTAAVLGSKAGVPFWLAIPAAGGAAAAVGLAAGPFALRLRGLYLAIITIGLVFVVNHVLLSFPRITGGVAGIAAPMHPWFAAGDPNTLLTSFSRTVVVGPLALTFERKLYALFVAIALATLWCGVNLRRTNTGRAMAAVRDHDLAAAVLGVNPARYKIIAFGVSSFFAGVAGAMFAYLYQFITVDPPFNLMMSIQYIAIIVIGGLGTMFGAVAGAVVFTVAEPVAEMVMGYVPIVNRLTTAQRGILFLSALVTAFMLFEPRGLFGIWLRVRRYFSAWPFRR